MSKNKPVDYSQGVRFVHPNSSTEYIVTNEADADNLLRAGWQQASASVEKKPVNKGGK